MLRVVLAVVLVACGLTWVAGTHAQEITGTVEGRVYYREFPDRAAGNQPMILIPSKLRDALSFAEALRDYSVAYNSQSGTFSISGVAPGEYLLGLKQNPDVLPTFDESILLMQGSSTYAFPATSVTVTAGQTTFVDIPLVIPPEWLTPEPTSAPHCPVSATAIVSGRIEIVGPEPYGGYVTYVSWLPADIPEPIQGGLYLGDSVQADRSGMYVIRCLEAGSYIIVIGRDTQFVNEPPDDILVRFYDEEFLLRGIEVTVSEGEHIENVDFAITFPDPGPIIDFPPTPTPIQHTEGPQSYDNVTLPGTGAGPSPRQSSDPWLVAILAGSATVTVAFAAFALQCLQRRR